MPSDICDDCDSYRCDDVDSCELPPAPPLRGDDRAAAAPAPGGVVVRAPPPRGGVLCAPLVSLCVPLEGLVLGDLPANTTSSCIITQPIDNSGHRVLPPGQWRLKLKIRRVLRANMCKFDAEIKSYKDEKTI